MRQPSMTRSAGFTLIEIMIVVMIVGLLMTTIATQLIGRAQRAQIDLARTRMLQVEQALELYRLDNGRYPTTEQGLLALSQEPTSEPLPRRYSRDGYAKVDLLDDPWGYPYQYEYPGTNNGRGFDLYSYGPDGVQGGSEDDADIVNWDTGT